MKPSSLLPLASAAIILACGQSKDSSHTTAESGDLNSLQDRVAALTGNTYPATGGAVIPAQFGGQASGNSASFASGQTQQPAQQQGGVRTITIPSKDFNMPMAQLDLPARWKVQTNPNGAWRADEPGLKVHDVAGGSFAYGQGQMAQLYQQAGMNMRAPMAPEQVVLQLTVPKMRQAGYELIGQNEAPAVAQADQRGLDGLYAVGQTSKTCRSNISEWRKGDERVALVMHWSAMGDQELMNWSYYFTQLETTAARFDTEKQALLTSLASLRFNPAYFAAYAQSEQQKANGSWAAHNQRMQGNQAAFDAQQRTHRETWDAVNNASMGGYNNTMNSMDHQQNATINGIRGEQDAINPYTGEAVKVQSGQGQYWMNSNGEYIGTDDVMYDPNANGQWVDQWRQAPTQP
ncbi:MAG: hypothetical protein KBF80_11750 [Flavobacteriales bacterium]|nr:hypothetical protein [Flavobacteriales bacterium]